MDVSHSATGAARADATKTLRAGSLRELLEPHFAEAALLRGNELFLDGRVEIRRGDDARVEARFGGGGHRAALRWEDGELRFQCGAHESAPDRPCEHIWSIVLECGVHGYLRAVRRQGEVALIAANALRAKEVEVVEESPRSESSASVAMSPIPTEAADVDATPVTKPPRDEWESRLRAVSSAMEAGADRSQAVWPRTRQLAYLIDVEASQANGHLVICVARRDRTQRGTFGRPRGTDLTSREVIALPDPVDHEILALLRGASTSAAPGWSASVHNPLAVPPAVQRALAPLLCASGRALLFEGGEADVASPLVFESAPWRIRLCLRDDGTGRGFLLLGELVRGERRIPVSEPALITDELIVLGRSMAPFVDEGTFEWVPSFRKSGPIRVAADDVESLIERLLLLPRLPPLDLPDRFCVESVCVRPTARLRLEDPPDRQLLLAPLAAELSFDYDGWIVSPSSTEPRRYQPTARRLVLRDLVAEQEAQQILCDLGVEEDLEEDESVFELPKDAMMRVVRELLGRGWHVEVGGRVVRRPVRISFSLQKHEDWLDLSGGASFEGCDVEIPEVLAALHADRDMVTLRDGSLGLLDARWRRRFSLLGSLGERSGDVLRIESKKAAVLDAVLADEFEATFDEAYKEARERLHRFDKVAPVDPPASFKGELRPYQREALGWFRTIAGFGFGGCLADDMGLGKTVQILALLETRRVERRLARDRMPSLVVAPRSLIFNWRREAERFAPELTVIEHVGPGRATSLDGLDADLVLTTYGVMVRDQELLGEAAFDYVILDEAQTIKNRGTRSSKAALRLRGQHRLALSGTPIENHVGELVSLFEFLNPGLLGAAAARRLGISRTSEPDEETVDVLRRLFRPFLLRRTKREVAKDLPNKVEQTLTLDLTKEERETYDEVRRYYRQSVLDRIEREGFAKSRLHVLEALLRLRQAACHPGLLDPKRAKARGAKVDLLVMRLKELVSEGHRAVVFSQFTKFLGIVREHLRAEGIACEYLDGKTRDRQGVVERFQGEGGAPVFLISIKAGGVGLNLTAADYVFLLDPWWNPAVEAQAIDRAWRIGQTRNVFAFRLIARDTVEERVAALQRSKREIAEALLSSDQSATGSGLSRDDLDMLLS